MPQMRKMLRDVQNPRTPHNTQRHQIRTQRQNRQHNDCDVKQQPFIAPELLATGLYPHPNLDGEKRQDRQVDDLDQILILVVKPTPHHHGQAGNDRDEDGVAEPAVLRYVLRVLRRGLVVPCAQLTVLLASPAGWLNFSDRVNH
jgi:hypothetical protein